MKKNTESFLTKPFYQWNKSDALTLLAYGFVSSCIVYIILLAGLSDKTKIVDSPQQVEQVKLKEETIEDRVLRQQFNPLTGTHIKLVDYIKSKLDDPGSFRHDETGYRINKTNVTVSMIFGAKNKFGGYVKYKVTATYSFDNQLEDIVYLGKVNAF